MRLIKTLLPIAALALSGIATASTKSEGEVNSVVVKYGDLNLNSQAGIARLHKRIRSAAQSVCNELDSRILGLRGAYEECIADAIANGVAAVDNANLNEFHASKGKRLVLAAQRR